MINQLARSVQIAAVSVKQIKCRFERKQTREAGIFEGTVGRCFQGATWKMRRK